MHCIPCMQKVALSSVLVTPAQKRPSYELSPDTVRDVFYALNLGPHISASPFQVLTIVQGMDGD